MLKQKRKPAYETGIVSRVAPEVETVLMDAIRKLLDVEEEN